MAKRQKKDINLSLRMEEIERRIFLLKILYEKYFSGIERIEPMKERDAIRKLVRETGLMPMTNTQQRFKYQSLKSKFSSFELYWQRNLVQIERGTHPKQKFRQQMLEKNRRNMNTLNARQPKLTAEQQEDLAYKAVYERFIEARSQCGQNVDLEFDSIRDTLKRQVRTIKSKFRVERVKFRVAIEDGKAKLKAVPVREDSDPS
ncbi:MAG: MXAN_5187 C-terminal domain-containing protein [Myxococcota bacterium]|nr:MXAN_5187 C-terminal domain-containing protein [Myxococcota bacterium]MEC8380884.1 MXAN_5187 C-terminal domain-containing protein [Myxococcota bacterium]